jgi:uncharacterized protein YutE (UPF0331/DUF86 family)
MTEAHLVAKKLALIETYLRELRTEVDVGRIGWIDDRLSTQLRRMAGFRNVLVHGYAEVDPLIVKDVVDRHLGDLDDFVLTIRARLPVG